MRALVALLLLITLGVAPAQAAADALAEARRLYNAGEYEEAARYAREAMQGPGPVESARLVLGRTYLELYRRSANSVDLAEAREALRAVDAAELDPRERAELAIGLGQTLFFEDRFGSASETFERMLDSSTMLGSLAHERLLDWWATALDRVALTREEDARAAVYARIVRRMEKELARNPASAAAAYWFAAGLRGAGDLERAWHAAAAGWVLAPLAHDRGAALRADLDRLVVRGIIPDRAGRLQPRDPQPAGAVMLAEWEAFKGAWAR